MNGPLERMTGPCKSLNMSKTLIIAMGILSFLFGSCQKHSPPAGTSQASSKFRAGQVWAIKTPADQPNAKITILRVENDAKNGTIVHAAITGVTFGNGQTSIKHLPFAEAAVEKSVTSLEREDGPVPDFAEGYRLWRQAFDAGKGGVFSITVADAYDSVTSVARQSK